jgi:SAM-dependent methyltransferase
MTANIIPLPLPSPTTTAALIARLVNDLDRLSVAESWAKASCYLTGYQQLAEQDDFKTLRGQQQARAINDALRRHAAEVKCEIPQPSFLAHAKKLNDCWPEIFGSGTKLLPYQHYRQLAVCSLPLDEREALRGWAETERPHREVLQQRIRAAVDARNGIHKPDFELKVSNFWKFNAFDDTAGYGAVHAGIYANLLYWFTDPGDIVLDPMAGTGTLGRCLGAYRFFRERYEADGSGPRVALMSDVVSQQPAILRADARDRLPFDDGIARLAIIDPPYLRVADDKAYAGIGKTLDDWLAALNEIIGQALRCVRPGGVLAVITDDVLRRDEHEPLAYRVTQLLAEHGLRPRATIYNHNPNFVYTMGPAQMLAMRKARLAANGCKIIQVASKEAK